MNADITLPTSAITAATKRLDVNAKNIAYKPSSGYNAQNVQLATLEEKNKQTIRNAFDQPKSKDLKQTGKTLDISIDGKGALPLLTPNGKVKFARSASFHQNEDGQLIDKYGNQLIIDQIAERAEIGHGASDINITKDGIIRGLNHRNEDVVLGQLQAAIPNDNGGFKYANPDTNGTGSIVSGALEANNTDITYEMVEQIDASANLKIGVKTVQSKNEMIGTIIDLVA